MAIDYDVQGALAAGIPLPQIADYLGQRAQFDVAAARKAGHSDVDIVGSLAGSDAIEGLQGGTGNLSRGAQTALGQTVPTLKGVVGLIGATAENAFGEGGVSTALKNWGLKGYKAGMEKIQPLSRDTDELTTAWEKAKQGDFGALVDWGTWAVGYGLGQVGESAAMAVVGGVAGAAMAPEAAPVTGAAGAVTGLVAQGAVKDMAQSLIKKAVVKEANRLMAESGGKLAAEAATKQATKAVTTSIGKGGALMGYETSMELGSIYADAEEQARKEGRELDGADLARVWGTGVLSGGVGMLGDKVGLDAVTGKLSSAMPGGRLARTVGGAVVAGTSNSAEEGVQTMLERVGAGKEVFSPEGINDIINSAGAGFVGSAPAGAFGGIISRQRQDIAVDKGKATLDQDLSVGGAQKAIDAAAAELRGATDAYMGVPPAAPPGAPGIPPTTPQGREWSPEAAAFMADRPMPAVAPQVPMGEGGLLPAQVEAQKAMGLVPGAERRSLVPGAYGPEAEPQTAAPAVNAPAKPSGRPWSPEAAAFLAESATGQPGGATGQPGGATPEQLRLTNLQKMVDRDSELTQQEATAGTQFERDQAAAQRAVNLEQRAPAKVGAASDLIDPTPMTSKQAMNRLNVLRDMVANEGGNALGLTIVPHPDQKGKFAIGQRELPNLKLDPIEQPVSEAETQHRLETAALTGKEQDRRAEDSQRQDMISRARASIEERGGVASPYEAQILREANLGQPYDRIDPSLGRPASPDQVLTARTGILVGSEAGLGYSAPESKAPRADDTPRSDLKVTVRQRALASDEATVAQARLEHAAEQGRLAAAQTDELQQALSRPTSENPVEALRNVQGDATTPADIKQLVDAANERKDAAETAEIERVLADDAAQAKASANAVAIASQDETANAKAQQIAVKARENLVTHLLERFAEPNGYFASAAIRAINKQLSVLQREPLTQGERARIDGLLGRTRAFFEPNLPADKPLVIDRGADNSSMERLIKPQPTAESIAQKEDELQVQRTLKGYEAGQRPADPLAGIKGETTTQADVQQLVAAVRSEKDAAETAEIERMLAEDAKVEKAKADAVRQASDNETAQAKAQELADAARRKLVDHLVERFAEPNGYFASGVIQAVNKQLSVLGREPLSKGERAGIDDLLGRTRAFLQPNLPSAPERVEDRGADNSSLESQIPERGAKGPAGTPKPKVPRPSKVGGVPTAQLTDEQLSATASNDQLPAITRRGATVELQAREEERQVEEPATEPEIDRSEETAPADNVYATKAEAKEAQRQQPDMRVVATDGGYTLVPKTEAQIAAQAAAAKRIAGGNVGTNGGPLNVNQFIASRGGLAEGEKSDLGVEGNVRVGSMWLFRKTGMSMDGAVEILREAGYLQNDDHNEARDLIQRTLRGEPQYTPAGWDQIAEAEAQSRFEEHLAAQQEDAAQAEDEWTPDALTAEDFQVAPELAQADDNLKAEVAALLDLAAAHEIDTESLLENAANATAEGTENDYYQRAQENLQAALAQSGRSRSDAADGGGAQGRPGQEAERGGRETGDENPGRPGYALEQPTREEVVARQDQDIDTLDDLAQIRRESEAGAGLFDLKMQDGRQDNTGSLFSTQRTGDTREVKADGETHSYTVVSGLTNQRGLTKVLREIARVFGKQVVFFQSGTLKVDGFVNPGNNRYIHINADSKMSPVAVLGHELMHLFKMDNPTAYRAIATVLARQVDEKGRALFRADYGLGANLEELSADLLGNAFQDPGFLASVFAEIGATAPEGQARSIVQRLVSALSNAITAALKVIQDMGVQPGFKADMIVKDLQAVRSALRLAMTEYAKGQREQAQDSAQEETSSGEMLASRTREQRQTETPAFKRWFGDSKVVDADGKPLVVYHASLEDFNEFKPQSWGDAGDHSYFYFAASKQWSKRFAKEEMGSDKPVLRSFYLSIKNPLDLTGVLDRTGKEWLDYFADIGVEPKANLKGKLEAAPARQGIPAWQLLRFDTPLLGGIREQLLAKGYDGLILPDVGRGRSDNTTYVAFEPTQIKSATSNNGEFDPANPDITMSRQRIFGDSGRTYTPEQLRMFQNVGRSVEEPTIKERIASLRKDLGKKLVQGIVDQFAPLKEVSTKAYQLARLSKGASGAMDAMLHHGKLSIRDGVYDADMSGGVLERLGVPLHGEFDDFLSWVAGNRAERLAADDRENLFTEDDIDAAKSLANGTTSFDYALQHGANAGQVTRDRSLIYADALKTFNEFHKNALDMAEQSGLIDRDARQIWENEFYVPFHRVSEEGFIGDTIKGGLVRQQAIKTLKGGTDKLNDLMANTLLNWAHLIDAAAKNRAALASLESAQQMGVAVEASEDIARQMAKSMGIKSQVVWAMEDGKKRFFVVEDKAMLQAITSLQYAGLKGPIMDALSTFKRVLTVGVTASPAFKIRNLARDSVQAIASAPLSYNLFKNLAEGYKASDPNSQTYVSALASGGLIRFGTMIEGNEAARTRQLIKMGVKDSTILNSKSKLDALWTKMEKGFMAYQELGNRGEEINRASLYKQLIDQGVPHGEAALQARDLMDFSLQGTFTTVRFLSQVVPFLNARLQGLYKLGRAGKEDPRRFAAVLGSVALASVALMMAYNDDDDWKKREDWDRNNYWWFKVGGLAYRIPKPFEIGAIATLAERGLDYFINPEMTGKRLYENVRDILMDQLSMDPIPQAVKPILDIYSNKDSFSGRPIEPMGMDRLRPDYRYTSSTSMLARGVSTAGQAVANQVNGQFLSPVQIDHLLHGYFSWLGTFVVGTTDMALRPLTGQAERPAADYWKVATQGIVQDANSPQSRYVSQMYAQAKEVEQTYSTWTMLRKQGRLEEASQFLEANADSIQRYKRVEGVKERETKINERIRMVERSSMSAADKKAQISELQAMRDQTARLLAE